jgi:hypothetical protein
MSDHTRPDPNDVTPPGYYWQRVTHDLYDTANWGGGVPAAERLTFDHVTTHFDRLALMFGGCVEIDRDEADAAVVIEKKLTDR